MKGFIEVRGENGDNTYIVSVESIVCIGSIFGKSTIQTRDASVIVCKDSHNEIKAKIADALGKAWDRMTRAELEEELLKKYMAQI